MSKRTKKTCANRRCGKTFTVPPKFRHQAYCSRDCFLQDKKRQNWQDTARNVGVFALVWAVSWATPAQSHHIADKEAYFKPLFRQASLQFWDDTPHSWELLSETARSESSYNPDAVSWANAIGMMQVMPKTWQEIAADVPTIGEDMTDARANILAGSYYLRRMYNIYKEPRPEEDRLLLTLASYNAGPGNLLRAQKLARADGLEGILWPEVASRLAKVTGSHAAGTVHYAESIEMRYRLRTQSCRQQAEPPLATATTKAGPSPERAKDKADAAQGISTAMGKRETLGSPITIHVHTGGTPPWERPLLFFVYTLLQIARRSEYGQPNPEA